MSNPIKIHRYPPRNPRCKECGHPKVRKFNGGNPKWIRDCDSTCPIETAGLKEQEAFFEQLKKRREERFPPIPEK